MRNRPKDTTAKTVTMVRSREDAPEGSTIVWEPQIGPQTDAYFCTVSMVLYGGARFGGKTEVSIAKTLAGNPDEDQSIAHNVSYVFHPGYRALVLRKNFKDLLDYKDRAAKIYTHFAGIWNSTGSFFEFPSGAKIVLGHLDSEEAYQIYQGQQYCRIFIEEVTQIKSKILFMRVVSSCRSAFKELHRQVFLTANPEGAGFHWVKEMFMTHPVTGKKVPPNTKIIETFIHPITGEAMELDRIFIPSRVWDNKIGMAKDPTYVAWLMSLPDQLRRAYLDGDWDAISGSTFFTEFRKTALEGEPESACHVVDSATVFHMPWQRMWCGLDWGYGHYTVCYWFFENDVDKRVYVCDELRVTRFGSYDLGMEWARRSLQYFSDPDSRKSITVYMSPDAWHKRDSSPEAEDISIVARFAKGAEFVLGRNAVYIPTADEMQSMDVGERLTRREVKVILAKAPNHRTTGWDHCRELLNWKPRLTGGDFDDRDYIQSLLQREDYIEEYTRYMKARMLASAPQCLPRLRIFGDRCPWLIAGIEAAVFDDDKQDVLKVDADPQVGKPGDDEIDAWRYGCAGWLRERQVAVPVDQRWLARVRDQMAKNPHLNGEQMAQMKYRAWAEEMKRSANARNPVMLPRRSSHWQDRAGQQPGSRVN